METKYAIRMLSKIELPENPRDCWLWAGTTNHGYPKCYAENQVQIQAQRAMYELCKGPLHGAQLTRTCENKLCMNPDHMLVTLQRR